MTHTHRYTGGTPMDLALVIAAYVALCGSLAYGIDRITREAHR